LKLIIVKNIFYFKLINIL